jgi:hypothetical protein
VNSVNITACPSLQLPKGPSIGELALKATAAAPAQLEPLVTSTRARRRRKGSESGGEGSSTDEEAVHPSAAGSTSPQQGSTSPGSSSTTGGSGTSPTSPADVMANASTFALAVAAKAGQLASPPTEEELTDLEEALEGLPGIEPQVMVCKRGWLPGVPCTKDDSTRPRSRCIVPVPQQEQHS